MRNEQSTHSGQRSEGKDDTVRWMPLERATVTLGDSE